MGGRWSAGNPYPLFSTNGRRHYCYPVMLLLFVGLCSFPQPSFLLQLVKDFLLHRERTSIFATSTAGDMRYLLLLILQTCILAGVCIFNYCNDVQPELVRHVSPFMLLGIYIGVSFVICSLNGFFTLYWVGFF